ncbi:MAG: DUF5069 domain-containing protein [Akkermansiaceae bacterium]
MSQIIPTVTSGIAGPLGVLHLPRLWQKASLDAVGKLHPDYPAAGAGFDQMTLDALGVNRETFLDFIKSNKPSYTQCEHWVLEQNGGSLDVAKIDAHNAAVIGYNHDDATRGAILSAVGIADNGSILDAVNLNNLEDWQDFHAAEIAS